MSRSALVGNVTAMLEDAGFGVSDRCAIRPKSFDVAARRGEDVLLLKILANVDAFDGATGAEMRRLGTYLGATPMVVGLRTRDEDLKPRVVYFRHGVPVIAPDTAMDLFIEEVPPLIYAAPGGLYVNIDAEILEDAREERDWSLGRLANELGVSRRTVSKYEDGMNASVEVDPEADPDDEPVIFALTRVGFDVHPTSRAPFKAVSEDTDRSEGAVLTGHSEFNRTAEKRARIMSSVGEVTRTRSLYVVDRATRDSVDGTALVEREEIEGIEDADDLRDLILERSDGAAESA
ncbi:transcriptional regulator [Halobacteriales archaeon QS_5_70_15]|nr:MAG: transcriptional regulator [Halobacteriales archaeon QS_5_70_15]